MGVLRLASVLVAFLLLATPALAQDQTLRRGNGAEPATLDPAKAEAVSDGHILDDLFEGLIILGQDNKVAPAAAESWTISPDGFVYTFKLHSDLKWSNGVVLTAADFVYAWRRAVDPATGSKYGFLYDVVKGGADIVDGRTKDLTTLGVRAVDPTTLEVTLIAPTGYFLGLLAHQTFFPVYRPNVEADGAAFTRPGKLISNGAFRLREWIPQSRVVAEKNPYFHDAAKIRLDEVQYFPIENEDEELKRYRADELDLTDNAPVDQMTMIRRDFAQEFIAPPYFGMYMIGFNTTRPPFKDRPGLRNALSMVLDRDAIVSDIMRRGEQPAYGWLPPGVPGYAPQYTEWHDWPMERRLAEARRLYSEAGYGPGHQLRVELRYNTSENHKKIMIAVAEMWKEALGVEVSLVNEEWKVFLETRKEKKLTEAFRDAWIGDYIDPNAFFSLETSDSGLNSEGYSSKDYDAAVAEAAVTIDPARRFGLFEQAERRLLADAPVAPLYFYVNPHLVKPWVEGYRPNLAGFAYSRDIGIGPGRPAGSSLGSGAMRVVALLFGVAAAGGFLYLVFRSSPGLVLRRLAGAVPTLFVIVTIAFFMIRLAPGGPFSSERAVPPEIEANLNRVYHLDQPLIVQYGHYLRSVLSGDFGPSFSYKDFTVTELIWQGFPVSMQLGLTAVLLAIVIGSALGTLAALRQNQAADYGTMAVAMTGITVPNFVMAPLLTLVFGVYLRWLPVGGWGGGSDLSYKILPIVALALPQIAYVARMMRGSMIEVLRSNYIRTARAKGLSEWLTVTRHAARAALLPVVSYLGPASAGIITGSVVIEQIFSLPGIGRYFVQGALNRDYTLVMGVVIFYGALIILFNLIVDMLYGVLDPKLART